jgi:energy-coupling factor transporter ATP-binding protein EcfA2
MDEGLKYINTISTKKNVVMVLGLSGTGKSTLVNYLNNIPLVSIKQKGVFIVDLKYPNVTLSECFAIGHKKSSKTLYPCSYSPVNEDFSYIDNPGFLDTRSLSIEIANGYFRKNILNNVENIKFLLLITHQSLQVRGVQFRNTIKVFSDFLGVFDHSDVDIQILVKSIGLIVTRVNNAGDTDEEMTRIFREDLLEILDEEKSKGELSQRQDMVFRQVIENSQIKIFSNPNKRDVVLDKKQKHDILDLIDNLDYIKKVDAKVRTQIQDTYIVKLNYYTTIKYNIFKKNVSDLFQTSLKKYFEKMTIKMNDVNGIKQVYIWLNNFIEKSNNTDLNAILNIFDYDVIDNIDKMSLIRMESYLRFFIDLMPKFNFDQNWYNADINDQVRGYLKKLEAKFHDKVKDFDKTCRIFFNDCLTRYYSTAIINMENNIGAFISIFNQLNATENIFNTKNELTFILDYIKENLEPNETRLNDLKQQIISFKLFFDLIDKTSGSDKFLAKKWTDINIKDKLNNFNNELVSKFEKSHKTFIQLIQKELKDQIYQYFQTNLLKANSLNDLEHFKFVAKNIKSNLIDAMNSVLIITKKLSEYNVISNLTKNKLDDIFLDQMKFINLLQKSTHQKKFHSLDSLNRFVSTELDNLLKELERFSEHDAIINNGIFTFKGHFSNISLIIDLINKNNEIKDLKTINIYNTNALVFDAHVRINADKYKTHAPDLIVFSPKVIFNKKEIVVDLTCQRTPYYPDNQEKAKDGNGYGADGMDGKPGLPGYNGGNLVIIADEILNSTNLKFISDGGLGGPGQHGKKNSLSQLKFLIYILTF